MNRPIVNILQLVGQPKAALQPYGIKTAGVVELARLAPFSPVPYSVPQGFAIEAGAHSRVTDPDLRSAFDALVQGRGEAVVVVRSSAVTEAPGKNPTKFVGVRAASPDDGFGRVREAVHEVGSHSRDMGVLLMPLVAGNTVAVGDQTLLGHDNVSFVADTHNPVRPDELSMAFVSGLGTHVVDANSEAILVAADRVRGKITSFINVDPKTILTPGFRLSEVHSRVPSS